MTTGYKPLNEYRLGRSFPNMEVQRERKKKKQLYFTVWPAGGMEKIVKKRLKITIWKGG